MFLVLFVSWCAWMSQICQDPWFVNGLWAIIYNWRKFTQRKESWESLPIIHHSRVHHGVRMSCNTNPIDLPFCFPDAQCMAYLPNIYHKFWPNVGKYTIHWASGIVCLYIFFRCDEEDHEAQTAILGNIRKSWGNSRTPSWRGGTYMYYLKNVWPLNNTPQSEVNLSFHWSFGYHKTPEDSAMSSWKASRFRCWMNGRWGAAMPKRLRISSRRWSFGGVIAARVWSTSSWLMKF